MKSSRFLPSFRNAVLVVSLAGLLSAQSPSPAGESTVTLDVGFGIRAVPPSRVTVPAGEQLRIVAPDLGGEFTCIWTKNGRALPARSERVLILPRVSPNDTGTYACLFSTPTTMPAPSPPEPSPRNSSCAPSAPPSPSSA
jgi:hypothetical protein